MNVNLAAVKVMHLCGDTKNIWRLFYLDDLSASLSSSLWQSTETQHLGSFGWQEKKEFMTYFIPWLVSLGTSCLVFVDPVLWLRTGPWPPHISRCQHFVWSSNTYHHTDSSSRWVVHTHQTSAISGHRPHFHIWNLSGSKVDQKQNEADRESTYSASERVLAKPVGDDVLTPSNLHQQSKHRTASGWKKWLR